MTTTRRKFIKKSSTIAIATGLASLPLHNTFSTPSEKNMFIHHVYFWMKPEATEQEKKKLLEGLKKLLKIETIKMSHIGVPATTNRPVIDRSYAYSLLLIFDNLTDQNIYQDHAIHQQFIKDCSMLWNKVVVYDSVNA